VKLWACYIHNKAFEEAVTSHNNLTPMHFAGRSQETVIEYLLKEEMATETRREYYNNDKSLRIEISVPFALGTRLEVYVITPLHIVNAKTPEAIE
jgi:hypothetical protein